MKDTIRHLALASLLVACTACGGSGSGKHDDTHTGDPNDPNTPPVVSNDPFPYTLVGRFDRTTNPNVARFDWSNSAIGVRFTGTSLAINLWDESTNLYGGSTPVQNLYNVVIDGGAPTVLQIVAGTKQYPLASNLAPGNHTAWITKRTEAQIGLANFASFVLSADGNFLTPPPVPARHIQVIGSSGDTGYGADGNVTSANMCHFTADTENADFSYPALMAKSFDATIDTIAFSGKGITRNLTAGDTKTLPLLAMRTVAGDANTVWQSKGTMDVVLIDAGGDDLEGDYGVGTLDQNQFVANYLGLIQKVRAQEPNAIIFGVLTSGAGGGDVATLGNAIQASIAAANQAGDPNVFYFAFQGYAGALGYGCDYHPNHAAAQMLAKQIAPAIQSKTGW